MSKPRTKPPQASPETPDAITVTEAARTFSDVVSRVRYRGESFTLTKGGVPVAEIRPIQALRTLSGRDLARRLRSLPHLGAAAAAALGDDIEAARLKLGRIGSGSWE